MNQERVAEVTSQKQIPRIVSMKVMWLAADTAERMEFLNFLQEQGVEIREADISFSGNS